MPGPGCNGSNRQQRDAFVEEIERHLDEAQGAAGMVSTLLEEDGNPSGEWVKVMEDIRAVLLRVEKLPR